MAKILVVDDEVGIRELLSEILADEGHEILLAESADGARRIREKARPDLVLLDIWMPDSDGITLLKEWGATGLLNMRRFEQRSTETLVMGQMLDRSVTIRPSAKDGGVSGVVYDVAMEQARNREDARQRLIDLLEKASVPPRPRHKTKPKYSAKLERLAGKKRRGETKRGRGRVRHDD